MRGDALEIFVEGYLRTSAIWQVAELAIVGQVPGNWLDDLNLANSPTGIDGVFQIKDGGLVPYQVKFRTGRPLVGVAEVGTFLGLTERGVRRVLISNSTRYADDIERRDRLRIIRGSDLDAISQDELHDITNWIYGQPIRPSRHSPRPHQIAAIDNINTALSGSNRATCVMACATGKTLVALWAAEAQQPRTVLVLLPSLALLGQTLSEWSRHTNWGERFEYRCVCSDPTVAGNPDDHWEVRSTEAPFPIDTDATGVHDFLSRPQSGAVRVVFSTYHSSPIVAEGMPEGMSFDVGIFDEAHQTTGAADSVFAFALRDENLPITKRLFFTATPRHIDVRRRDRNDDFQVVSMDDVSVYGTRAHTLAFAEAVAQGLICDYRIVISVVDPLELPQVALQHGMTLVQGDETNTRWVARQLALQRAIADTGVSKVITFHSRVAHAQAFASDTSRGIPQYLDGFKVDHVNGTQAVASRRDILRGFADDSRRLVTNARCLTEGVDIPAVDMVAFCSPRRSTVDIVQTVGRAMRKPASGTKKVGYVVLPLLLPQSAAEDLEAAVAKTDWDELIDVIAALREHDVRLYASLQAIQVARGEGLPFNPRDLLDRIDVIGPHISLDIIRRSLTSILVEKLCETWDFRYGELRKFRETEGHCNVPRSYPANKQLALWIHTQRYTKRRNRLSAERIQRLEALGFVWDQFDAAWEEMFTALAAFKEEQGHCNVPQSCSDNPQLGSWVNSQRTAKKCDRLPAERIQRLEDLGFVWDPIDAAWEEMFTALVTFKEEHGHCNVPQSHPANPQLGTWVGTQRSAKRRNRLSAEQIQRLEALGFVWDPIEAGWEEMFAALAAFKEEHGHCNVPRSYPVSPRLATWVTQQRSIKKRNQLPAGRIQRLEALGFVWDPRDAGWEEMFAALAAFKQEHGHCNVPDSYAANPQLRTWVNTQRRIKKLNRLPAGRIQRLEALGFVWDPRDTVWEEMFSALAAVKQERCHCNVPDRHPANPQLGTWVRKQRSFKRRNRLPAERVQRLDALGFVWDPIDAAWEEMFAALAAFKEEHGHCNVPQSHPINPQLGTWVANQRSFKRRNQLPAGRIQRFEALGFVWDPRDAAWEEMFPVLAAFKGEHGHCNVPDSYAANPQLGTWVSTQRSTQKRNQLPAGRIQRLEALGFVWDLRDAAWEEMFAALAVFKEEHGHCNVPDSYAANPQLGNWVATQRSAKRRNSLPAERIQRLETLGFVWARPRL
jgi:superfamily II DNA or RNA helicase